MKKLFEMRSAITIDENNQVRITGPYQLLSVQASKASFATTYFTIHIDGEDLLIQTLSEEVAELTFSSIQSIECKVGDEDDSTKI